MSAVLKQTKQLYKKTLVIECILLVAVTAVVGVGLGIERSISVLLGEVAALLPHCVFVYWVFFRQSVNYPHKMTAFYRGEGLKWLTAIVVIVVALKSYGAMHYFSFFCGFFFILLCNSLLPIILKSLSK
ncbi:MULTISPECIES: ATP synthase subunit I [Glaesserella]|uniref:F0F1 ATP synthase subunit I n=1 Tax=Glaesserella australis TaxID=2094024 RepID=A0A328BW04_9PAST|nr:MULTISPECIES: ATP synthase subunit I [Glaesserella]AUI66726.1 F0F1 ATP synthase subunit I [Glaesserella sp. 15-184]RAL17881.1 F0F1 ATP synthase subunit I [Glaesserella australis]